MRLTCGFGAVLVAGLGTMPVCAQDPLKTLPNNYKMVLENGDVAVIRAHYGGHEKIAVHDHTAFATVFVYLNDAGSVRIDHAEGGKVEAVVRPPTVQGAYRVAAGIAERHSIENLGDKDSDFLRVELKRVSLATLREPFRGKAPASLASEDAVEFTAPGLEIERIVCAGGSPCAVKAAPAASLVIAFTPVTLTAGGRASERLEAGACGGCRLDRRIRLLRLVHRLGICCGFCCRRFLSKSGCRTGVYRSDILRV